MLHFIKNSFLISLLFSMCLLGKVYSFVPGTQQEIKTRECIEKHKKNLKNCKNLKNFQELSDDFFKELNILWKDIPDDLVQEYFQQLIDDNKELFRVPIHIKEEYLLKKGFLAWSVKANHWIYFQTESKYFCPKKLKWIRVLRYKIKLESFTEPVGKVRLVLLNDEKFEIKSVRVPMKAPITGKIELEESEYLELSDADLREL